MSALKKIIEIGIVAVLFASATAYAQTEDEKKESTSHEAAGGWPNEAELHEGATEHDPTHFFNFTNFSFRGKDELGGPYGDGKMVDPHTGEILKAVDHKTGKLEPAEEEPMSPPFVLMLLNFGLLLLILGKYGGPAARKIAEERHDAIKTALDDAAKLRTAAAKKLAEYEARIKDVDVEVKKLVDGIRADAEADKKRILEATAIQAAAMKKDAEQRIATEIELARAQLTKEVTAAAAGATEKLLRDKVSSDDQNKLVSTFITNVQTGSSKEAR